MEKFTKEIINKRRTQLDLSAPINLHETADAVRKLGYFVYVQRGGSLLVSDFNGNEKNTITITKKNAYIENAALKTKAEKDRYNKMKQIIKDEMIKSIENSKEKDRILNSSPELCDMSIREITTNMMRSTLNETREYGCAQDKNLESYRFLDKKGDEYLKMERTFDKENGHSYIKMAYGEKYGSSEWKVEITDKELEHLKNDTLHQSKLIRTMEYYINTSSDHYKSLSTKDSDDKRNPIACSYSVTKGNEMVYDSRKKEPVTYDREWITRLARLQDKLIDLRNGPVQMFIGISSDITSGIIKPYKDGALSGIEVLSGLNEARAGFSFGKHLAFLEIESNKIEKELQKLKEISASTKREEADKLSKINDYKLELTKKKTELQYIKNEVLKDKSLYLKSAVKLRKNIDEMIYSVCELKRQAIQNVKHKKDACKAYIVDSVKTQISKLSYMITNSFHALENSLKNVIHNMAVYTLGELNKSKEMETVTRNSNQFKTGFNSCMMDAKTILDQKEYSKEYIAKISHDSRIMKMFENVSINEFRKLTNVMFYDELTDCINRGIMAKSVPEEERDSDDIIDIEMSAKARAQKQQDLYVAENLEKKICQIVNNPKITKEEAIHLLAKTYHDSAMIYCNHNKNDRIKYEELDYKDTQACEFVAKSIIETLPNLEEKLQQNEMENDKNENYHNRQTDEISK